MSERSKKYRMGVVKIRTLAEICYTGTMMVAHYVRKRIPQYSSTAGQCIRSFDKDTIYITEEKFKEE